MNNERDTHFANAAKLLFAKLDQEIGPHLTDTFYPEDARIWNDTVERMRSLIAQFAYDLVEHASECINDKQLEEGMRLTSEYMLEVIPDLTEWPKSADSLDSE